MQIAWETAKYFYQTTLTVEYKDDYYTQLTILNGAAGTQTISISLFFIFVTKSILKDCLISTVLWFLLLIRCTSYCTSHWCTFKYPSWANLCSSTLDCTANLQLLKRQRSVTVDNVT